MHRIIHQPETVIQLSAVSTIGVSLLIELQIGFEPILALLLVLPIKLL